MQNIDGKAIVIKSDERNKSLFYSIYIDLLTLFSFKLLSAYLLYITYIVS